MRSGRSREICPQLWTVVALIKKLKSKKVIQTTLVNSKFEGTKQITSSYQYFELPKSWRHSYQSLCKYLKFNLVMHRRCLVVWHQWYGPCMCVNQGCKELNKTKDYCCLNFIFTIQDKCGNSYACNKIKCTKKKKMKKSQQQTNLRMPSKT